MNRYSICLNKEPPLEKKQPSSEIAPLQSKKEIDDLTTDQMSEMLFGYDRSLRMVLDEKFGQGASVYNGRQTMGRLRNSSENI